MTIRTLYKNKKEETVFTLADIARLTGNEPDANFVANVNYYVSKGDLLRISKGLYALDVNYSRLELGNKLRRPSYVSFYTVLQAEGLVFQPYSDVFLAANRSEVTEVDGTRFVYRKLKDDFLLNTFGVNISGSYSVATAERALCDKLYLDGEEYFDNLSGIDWQLVDQIVKEVYSSIKLGDLVNVIRNNAR